MTTVCPGTTQYATNVRDSLFIPDTRGGVLAWFTSTNPEDAAQMGATGTAPRSACRHCKGDGFEVTDEGTPRFHHLPSGFVPTTRY